MKFQKWSIGQPQWVSGSTVEVQLSGCGNDVATNPFTTAELLLLGQRPRDRPCVGRSIRSDESYSAHSSVRSWQELCSRTRDQSPFDVPGFGIFFFLPSAPDVS